MILENAQMLTPEQAGAWAALAEKYGLAMMLTIVLLVVILTILYWFMTARIVSKIYLDDALKRLDLSNKHIAKLVKAVEDNTISTSQLIILVKGLERVNHQDGGG